ncbi:hypothetical protein ASG82_19030 [Mycobacterium sp. Soil538]|nr:hypothetical protein ASG82_19030 [Mycobacterium sp. Soil538]
MMPDSRSLPDIAPYLDLIDSFLHRLVAAIDFQLSYLSMVKSEQRILGAPVYPILQELFEDADAYVSDPELRTESEDLDDDQLFACARRAREALRHIGYE